MILNDKHIQFFDMCIKERPVIPTPERDVEFIEIKGRDGSLTRKHGFLDILYSVEVNIIHEDNVKKTLREFKGFLLGVKTLTLADDTDVYYKVKKIRVGDIENEIKEYGSFELEFTLDPYQYFYSGDTWIDVRNNTNLVNMNYVDALPLLEIVFSGSGTNNNIKIGDTLISQKTSKAGTYYIDSEQEEIYTQFGNAINDFNFTELPKLIHGDNKITGNFTKARMKCRWRAI